jgi:beta-lactamase regulating signal transducer with metallopeptidase domain
MIVLMFNHLWQSSLCVAGAGLLALALHRNGANVRFWLWFAASVKFLVPFAALTALSAYLLAPMLPPVVAPTVTLVEPLAEPFSSPAAVQAATKIIAQPSTALAPSERPGLPTSPVPHVALESLLISLWSAGFLVLTSRWLVRWWRVRTLLREAVDVHIDAPIAVKFSASRLEPGLVGILRPVILLPQGIEGQVSQAELKAILAHEFCHWRRHDNFMAAIHMLVEATFWFFPLVWWLGGRLNAERERACDESVLAQGTDPQMYAEGILKVCRAYLQSPLACVAGVSGADLKKRIETIAENRLILQLNAARKLVLSASAAIALGLPLAVGLLVTPVTQIQVKAAQVLPLVGKTEQLPPPVEPFKTALPANRLATNGAARHSQPGKMAAPYQTQSPSLDVSQPLPAGPLFTPSMVALNEPPATAPTVTQVPAAGETPGTATAAYDQSVGPQSATQALPDVPATTGLLPYQIPFVDGQSGPLVAASRNDLSTKYICYNSSITGRVLSTRAILIGSFVCQVHRLYHRTVGEQSYSGFIMNIELGRSSDVERMARGKSVTIGGKFKVLAKNDVIYLVADDAKVLSVTNS